GRTGRGEKPPPQFGQTSNNVSRTQVAQNVHSNEQIIASVESGGRSRSHSSQLGRSASLASLYVVLPSPAHVAPRSDTHDRATADRSTCRARATRASSVSAWT